MFELPGDMCGRRRDEDGFVLVSVIGALLLISLIGMTLMRSSESETLARAAMEAHGETTAFADGMLRLTALKITDRRTLPSGRPLVPSDGTPAYCRDEDRIVEARVYDTSGLININSASADMLEYLLVGFDMLLPDAQKLAAAIIDFRDADDTPMVGGAESLDYQQAGRPYGPKNAAFDSIDELDQVLGMTPELLQRMRPFLTVHSSSRSFETALAPIELLQIIAKGYSGAPVGGIAPSRDSLRLPPQLTTKVGTRGTQRGGSRTFQVRISVKLKTGAQFTREAAIDLSQATDLGFVVRSWGARPSEPMPAGIWSAQTPPCETSL